MFQHRKNVKNQLRHTGTIYSGAKKQPEIRRDALDKKDAETAEVYQDVDFTRDLGPMARDLLIVNKDSG